jgi:cell division protease FtsH
MPEKGDYGAEVERTIDAETRRIIEEQHTRVLGLLRSRLDALVRAAARLLEVETLSGEELRAVVEARPRPTLAAAPA